MARSEKELPLDEAALIIAAGADPNLDVSAQLARLDDVAAQIGTVDTGPADTGPADTGPVDTGPADTGTVDTEQVCRLVFETLGVRGDDQTYDDPRNSYLDQVLDRRLGIPISLSVLLMEIGRRCGVVLEGVGMPGHFLVRDPGRPELLIDAFAGGRRLDHPACAQLLRASLGPDVDLQPGMLAPVGPRIILARMLGNLDYSFRRRGDRDGVLWVTRLRVAIPDLSLADRVALAEGLAGLGCYDEAAALLEELADGPGVSAEVARSLLARARRLLAALN